MTNPNDAPTTSELHFDDRQLQMIDTFATDLQGHTAHGNGEDYLNDAVSSAHAMFNTDPANNRETVLAVSSIALGAMRDYDQTSRTYEGLKSLDALSPEDVEDVRVMMQSIHMQKHAGRSPAELESDINAITMAKMRELAESSKQGRDIRNVMVVAAGIGLTGVMSDPVKYQPRLQAYKKMLANPR